METHPEGGSGLGENSMGCSGGKSSLNPGGHSRALLGSRLPQRLSRRSQPPLLPRGPEGPEPP